jgi:hypothetical protein
VYSINEYGIETLANFEKKAFIAAVHNESIIFASEGVIEVTNMYGTVK